MITVENPYNIIKSIQIVSQTESAIVLMLDLKEKHFHIEMVSGGTQFYFPDMETSITVHTSFRYPLSFFDTSRYTTYITIFENDKEHQGVPM